MATPQVLGSGGRLQVSRIDAVPNAAEMIQVKAIGDGSNVMQIEDDMGRVGAPNGARRMTIPTVRI
jgi:hypothetical protein